MVFERRIKNAFGEFFSVCDLDRCRAAILGAGRDSERYDELHAFHCESFKGMTSAERQTLVDKAAQYVGVGLAVAMKPAGRLTGLVASAAVGLAIGGASAWTIATAQNGKVATRTDHAERLANEIQLPILPVPRAIEVSSEPVFNTAVRTNQPAATARRLASAVQSMAGQYDVSLTVTPVEGGADPVLGAVMPTGGKKAGASASSQPGRDR